MILTRTISISGGGVTVQSQQRVNVTSPHPFEQTIPANSIDVLIKEPDLILADCKCMAIVADQDCVVKTNSPTTPTETLSIKAGVPLMWMTGDPVGNKFVSADVTNWYATIGGKATKLTILVANDATPTVPE